VAKRGRPSKYRPEFPRQAQKLCLLGATNEKLADFFSVAVSTVDKWIKEIPEFSGALKSGRDDADARVANSLFRRALGYKHKTIKIFQYEGQSFEHEFIEQYPPDPTSCIFWLKNRQPQRWRDKPISEDGDDRLNEVLDLIRDGPAVPNHEAQSGPKGKKA
jgi:hypothetical protein